MVRSQRLISIILGGEVDVRSNAALKAYYFPGVRSEITGVPAMTLFTHCMSKLGLEQPWNYLRAFIDSCPQHHQVTPVFIATGSAPSHLNSVKIYFRTQVNTLGGLIKYMTMDGALGTDNEEISTAVDSLRRLWQLLFGADVKDDTAVHSLQPLHPTTGFTVYYDIGHNNVSPRPKICITVKHFCKNDEVIAQALSQYYEEIGSPLIAQSYKKRLQAI
jgi:tryptophan 7-dimethylallyltransferase